MNRRTFLKLSALAGATAALPPALAPRGPTSSLLWPALPWRRRCHVRYNGRWLDHVVWADTLAGWCAVVAVDARGKVLENGRQGIVVCDVWGEVELWLQPEDAGRRRTEWREPFPHFPGAGVGYVEYYEIDEDGLWRISPRSLAKTGRQVPRVPAPAGPKWEHPVLL